MLAQGSNKSLGMHTSVVCKEQLTVHVVTAEVPTRNTSARSTYGCYTLPRLASGSQLTSTTVSDGGQDLDLVGPTASAQPPPPPALKSQPLRRLRRLWLVPLKTTAQRTRSWHSLQTGQDRRHIVVQTRFSNSTRQPRQQHQRPSHVPLQAAQQRDCLASIRIGSCLLELAKPDDEEIRVPIAAGQSGPECRWALGLADCGRVQCALRDRQDRTCDWRGLWLSCLEKGELLCLLIGCFA